MGVRFSPLDDRAQVRHERHVVVEQQTHRDRIDLVGVHIGPVLQFSRELEDSLGLSHVVSRGVGDNTIGTRLLRQNLLESEESLKRIVDRAQWSVLSRGRAMRRVVYSGAGPAT